MWRASPHNLIERYELPVIPPGSGEWRHLAVLLDEVEAYRQEAKQTVLDVKCATHISRAHQQAGPPLELAAPRQQNLHVGAATISFEGEVEVRGWKCEETRDPLRNALLRGEHLQNRERVAEIGLQMTRYIEVLARVEVADLDSRDRPTSRELRHAALGERRCAVERHRRNRWIGKEDRSIPGKIGEEVTLYAGLTNSSHEVVQVEVHGPCTFSPPNRRFVRREAPRTLACQPRGAPPSVSIRSVLAPPRRQLLSVPSRLDLRLCRVQREGSPVERCAHEPRAELGDRGRGGPSGNRPLSSALCDRIVGFLSGAPALRSVSRAVADQPADDSSALPVSDVAAIVVLPASAAKSPAWTLSRPTVGRSGESENSPETSALGAIEHRPLVVAGAEVACGDPSVDVRAPKPAPVHGRADGADPRQRSGPHTPRAPSIFACTSAAKSLSGESAAVARTSPRPSSIPIERARGVGRS